MQNGSNFSYVRTWLQENMNQRIKLGLTTDYKEPSDSAHASEFITLIDIAVNTTKPEHFFYNHILDIIGISHDGFFQ